MNKNVPIEPDEFDGGGLICLGFLSFLTTGIFACVTPDKDVLLMVIANIGAGIMFLGFLLRLEHRSTVTQRISTNSKEILHHIKVVLEKEQDLSPFARNELEEGIFLSTQISETIEPFVIPEPEKKEKTSWIKRLFKNIKNGDTPQVS